MPIDGTRFEPSFWSVWLNLKGPKSPPMTAERL